MTAGKGDHLSGTTERNGIRIDASHAVYVIDRTATGGTAFRGCQRDVHRYRYVHSLVVEPRPPAPAHNEVERTIDRQLGCWLGAAGLLASRVNC
jgi:hypothetical protein